MNTAGGDPGWWSIRAVVGSPALSGAAAVRALAIACVAVAVAAICVVLYRQPAGEPATGGLDPDTAPVESGEPSDSTLAAAGLPDDVVSRVDAASRTLEARTGRSPETSHIGPRLDPEAESYEPSDAAPSHVGEPLDPDADFAPTGESEVSHIGEYLDPLADE